MLLLLLLACPNKTPSDDTGSTNPNLTTALGNCDGTLRTPDAYPNQLSDGTDLQRHFLLDPDAVCNDGSPGVIFVRSATDPQLGDVWSIHLQGGGGCWDYASCAVRYCGSDYYDASKMSSAYVPESIAGTGIASADPSNAFAGANHVFVYFCSSDAWSGQGARTVSDEAGSAYTLPTAGHTIITSTVAALESGVTGEGGDALPSLRDAALVMLSGTAEGAWGALHHADWLAARLEGNGTFTFAILDAGHNPPREVFAETERAAYDSFYQTRWEQSVAGADYTPWTDQTCLGTTDDSTCGNPSYVLRNHITTPFFVRQDLQDADDLAVTLGIALDDYETLTHAGLATLPSIIETGAEVIPSTPGVYGPNCGQHVALESTDWWTTATVDLNGVPTTFQDAVLAWYLGEQVYAVDAPLPGEGSGPGSVCVALDDEH